MTDTPKLCKHGSLRRQCEICDLAEDVDRLQAENALLKAAVRDADECGVHIDWRDQYAAAINIAGKP